MASVATSSDEVGAGGGSGSSAASDSKLKALREDLMLKAQLAQVQYSTCGVWSGEDRYVVLMLRVYCCLLGGCLVDPVCCAES